MHNLKVGNIEIEYAAGWNELSREQLINIAQLMLKGLAAHRFRFFALLILLEATVVKQRERIINKIPHFYIKRKKDRFLLSSIVFQELMDSVKFLQQDSRLTVNLFPVIKHRVNQYYGPADGLFNVSFEEFLLADKAYYDFMLTREDAYLDRLVAILYRKRNADIDTRSVDYQGDVREAFNDFLIDDRQKTLSKLKPHFKLGVFLYVQGCKFFLKEKFPLVFKAGTGGKDDGLGYMSLVDSMNGGDATKNEVIRKLNVYDALTRLQKAAEASEKLKEQTKKRR